MLVGNWKLKNKFRVYACNTFIGIYGYIILFIKREIEIKKRRCQQKFINEKINKLQSRVRGGGSCYLWKRKGKKMSTPVVRIINLRNIIDGFRFGLDHTVRLISNSFIKFDEIYMQVFLLRFFFFSIGKRTHEKSFIIYVQRINVYVYLSAIWLLLAFS